MQSKIEYCKTDCKIEYSISQFKNTLIKNWIVKLTSQNVNIQKSTNQNMTIQNCNSTKYTSVIHTNQKYTSAKYTNI